MNLETLKPKRRLSLSGMSSTDTAALELTAQHNRDIFAMNTFPVMTENHQKKINEILDLALSDLTYKLKIKYITLPERKENADNES
jgi:hypothetical protein